MIFEIVLVQKEEEEEEKRAKILKNFNRFCWSRFFQKRIFFSLCKILKFLKNYWKNFFEWITVQFSCNSFSYSYSNFIFIFTIKREKSKISQKISHASMKMLWEKGYKISYCRNKSFFFLSFFLFDLSLVHILSAYCFWLIGNLFGKINLEFLKRKT